MKKMRMYFLKDKIFAYDSADYCPNCKPRVLHVKFTHHGNLCNSFSKRDDVFPVDAFYVVDTILRKIQIMRRNFTVDRIKM